VILEELLVNKATSMRYIGIAIAVLGLVAVYFSAGTNWIYLSTLMSAVGGAIFGASLSNQD